MNGIRRALFPAILLGASLSPTIPPARAATVGTNGGLASQLIARRDLQAAILIKPAAMTAEQYQALLREEKQLQQQEASLAGQFAGVAATVRAATSRLASDQTTENLLLARQKQVSAQLARMQAAAVAQHRAYLTQEATIQQQERKVAEQLANNLALVHGHPNLAGQYRSIDNALRAQERQLSSQLKGIQGMDATKARAFTAQERPFLREEKLFAQQGSGLVRSIGLDGRDIARGLQLETSLLLREQQVAAQLAIIERLAATPSSPGR